MSLQMYPLPVFNSLIPKRTFAFLMINAAVRACADQCDRTMPNPTTASPDYAPAPFGELHHSRLFAIICKPPALQNPPPPRSYRRTNPPCMMGVPPGHRPRNDGHAPPVYIICPDPPFLGQRAVGMRLLSIDRDRKYSGRHACCSIFTGNSLASMRRGPTFACPLTVFENEPPTRIPYIHRARRTPAGHLYVSPRRAASAYSSPAAAQAVLPRSHLDKLVNG